MKASAVAIGELAAQFGIPAHVLRYWESEGLLNPQRHAGQRRYGPDEMRQVAFIQLARESGFGIRALRTLLSTPDPMAHPDLLRDHLAMLDRRIAEAQATKALIEHAMRCPDSFHDCPHARNESNPASRPNCPPAESISPR